jgi:hypothetical protein
MLDLEQVVPLIQAVPGVDDDVPRLRRDAAGGLELQTR